MFILSRIAQNFSLVLRSGGGCQPQSWGRAGRIGSRGWYVGRKSVGEFLFRPHGNVSSIFTRLKDIADFVR